MRKQQSHFYCWATTRRCACAWEGASQRNKALLQDLTGALFCFSPLLLEHLMLGVCVRLSWGGPGEDTQWGGEPVATGPLYCWEGDGAERGPVHTANAACRLYALASLSSRPGPSFSRLGLFLGVQSPFNFDWTSHKGLLTVLSDSWIHTWAQRENLSRVGWKRGANFHMNLLCSFWGYRFLLRGDRKRITRCMPSQTICWIFKNWMPSWKKSHIQSLWKGNFIWLGRVLITVFNGILA